MFTLSQIKQAHLKVKSGADFPGYIQELKALGVIAYDNYVADGTTHYRGWDNYAVKGDPKYPMLEIAATSSQGELSHALRVHQSGGSDYPTFCKEAARFGVEK